MRGKRRGLEPSTEPSVVPLSCALGTSSVRWMPAADTHTSGRDSVSIGLVWNPAASLIPSLAGGTAVADIKFVSAENPELSKASLFKDWSGSDLKLCKLRLLLEILSI